MRLWQRGIVAAHARHLVLVFRAAEVNRHLLLASNEFEVQALVFLRKLFEDLPEHILQVSAVLNLAVTTLYKVS